MKMTPKEAETTILEINDSLDTIGQTLKWLLQETTEKNMTPGTPVGNEMIRRFFNLHGDFKRLRERAGKFHRKIRVATFDDETDKAIWKGLMELTMSRFGQGAFHQFDSVAETGRLPDDE